MRDEDLPDFTPTHINSAIKEFIPNLCCEVNPTVIVYRKRVCQRCFDVLRASYGADAWMLGGGSE